MPLISRAAPISSSETLTSDSEMRLRLKSKNREIEEFQIATPGMRLMIPSRTKRRIAARSTSGRDSLKKRGSETGRVCRGRGRSWEVVAGGARLLGAALGCLRAALGCLGATPSSTACHQEIRRGDARALSKTIMASKLESKTMYVD
jgi:hypothetical protein